MFHGVAGGVFFVLDCTGVGAIASEIGKAGGKIGLEILGKEAVVRLAENTVVKEEGVKLGVRGLERNKKQEKLSAA